MPLLAPRRAERDPPVLAVEICRSAANEAPAELAVFGVALVEDRDLGLGSLALSRGLVLLQVPVLMQERHRANRRLRHLSCHDLGLLLRWELDEIRVQAKAEL